MIDSLESIDIRVGTPDDRELIAEFALALSEDPISSRDKWLEIIKEENVYPLIAVKDQNIVGKIQARIIDDIGWLESAKVSPDARNRGIAHSILDAALDWLIAKGVKKIRTLVDSDNLSARRIVEKNHFSVKFLSINPSSRVFKDDGEPNRTEDFAAVLDEELFPIFFEPVKKYFSGNIMVDGRYVPFNQNIFENLISQRRIYANRNNSILLVLSEHNLPSEYFGFVISNNQEGYSNAALALRGFASREMATIAVCHAPATRQAVVGLAKGNFAWSQPHSLILYERSSWEGKNNNIDM